MAGLENMSTRLNFSGGKAQIKRMNEDKLKSLKKALLYSYQSATAILKDRREFRCLINPDHLKNQYDDKIISIPFEDICLNKNKQEIETIDIKPGDVFTWKENNSDWLVFLRRLEETAYFRAEIRRCKYTVTIDEIEYKCYAARPSVSEIDWRNQDEKLWNDIDYTLQMYITKDEITEKFFHRFSIIKVNNQPWEVQSIDSMSSDGIIIVYLKEWYNNTIAEEKAKEDAEKPIPEPPKEGDPIIEGDKIVYPYDKKVYNIKNASEGNWIIGSTKAKILEQDENHAKIEILSGRSGNFDLKYIRDEQEDVILNITIESL